MTDEKKLDQPAGQKLPATMSKDEAKAVFASLMTATQFCTFTDADVDLFFKQAEDWAHGPSGRERLKDYLSLRAMVHQQILDHLALHPPKGSRGPATALKAIAQFRDVGVAIREALKRIEERESTIPTKAERIKSDADQAEPAPSGRPGRPAHRGPTGPRRQQGQPSRPLRKRPRARKVG